jgi:hypothetical protein
LHFPLRAGTPSYDSLAAPTIQLGAAACERRRLSVLRALRLASWPAGPGARGRLSWRAARRAAYRPKGGVGGGSVLAQRDLARLVPDHLLNSSCMTQGTTISCGRRAFDLSTSFGSQPISAFPWPTRPWRDSTASLSIWRRRRSWKRLSVRAPWSAPAPVPMSQGRTERRRQGRID